MKYIKNKSLVSKAKNQIKNKKNKNKKGNYQSKKSQLMDKCFHGTFDKNFGNSLASNALSSKNNKEARNRNLLRTFAQKLLNKEKEKDNLFSTLMPLKVIAKAKKDEDFSIRLFNSKENALEETKEGEDRLSNRSDS